MHADINVCAEFAVVCAAVAVVCAAVAVVDNVASCVVNDVLDDPYNKSVA